MSDEFILYTTVDGDRWDTIAQRMYGSPHLYRPIVEANRHVPIRPVLDGGIVLHVPVRETLPRAASAELPPWKRSTP